jgi:hypothetical protein
MPKCWEGRIVLVGLGFFAIWIFVVLPFLYAVPRLESPRQTYRDDHHQGTAAEPRGTEDAPFFIQVVPSRKTAEERTQEADDREEKKSADRWLVRWTAMLFIATVGLILATGLLGYFAFRQARDTKTSIDLARAEFVSTHRPKIILRDAHLIGEEVLYMLVNVGATSATVVESWIMAEFVETGTRLRPLRSFGHDDLGRLNFAGGESKDLTYPLPAEISFAIKFPGTRRIGIEDRPAVFGERYFVGVLVYEDDLRVKRRSIFRRRWDDKSLTFSRLSPEEERDQEYSD